MELPADIWKYSAQWLNDTARFNLMITNKEMIKLGLIFYERYDFHNIFGSAFYNNFTNICIAETIMILNKKSINGNLLEFPNKMNMLQIHRHRFLKGDIIIPPSVNYLLISDKENYLNSNVVNYIIPDSVKYCYLSFNNSKPFLNLVTHLIVDNINTETIPESVTHLALSEAVKNIPSSVTHLQLDFHYMIHKNFIPSSVKYLKINESFDESKDCLPSSITHLVLGDIFYGQLKIPSSVTHLTISKDSWKKFPRSLTSIGTPCGLTHKDLSERSFMGYHIILKEKYQNVLM